MTLAFITYAMLFYNRQKFAICSKTTQAAERNIIDPLFNIEGFPYKLRYNKASRVLEAHAGKSFNQFHIFGGNDEKSASRIQGITLQSVFFDEVALMPESFVNQALGRMVTNPDAKAWFNCNPDSPAHWFYKKFIKEQKESTKYIHFTMRDNPIMTERAIRNAEQTFSGVFYNRYILGQWCVAEGAIYTVFSENKERYFTSDVRALWRMNVNIGLDFGGNESKHAVTATAIDLLEKKIYVLRSQSFSAKNVTPDELYRRVINFKDGIESQFSIKVDAIYADSAEQTLINGLRSRIDTPVRNSVKEPINDRIRCTTSLMATGGFFMIKENCTDLAEAFEMAVWNEKKPTVDVRLDNGTYNVDILDSFEYSWERYIRSLAREVVMLLEDERDAPNVRE
jgi:PBSX family phage terminase large subunit